MKDLLFAEQRIHPKIYDVKFQGKWERTVSIRGGIAWPQPGIPGYLVLAAQLEKKDPDHNWRFLAFYEDQAPLMRDLCKKVASACSNWRIDYLCHGDEPGEESFSNQLWEYLQKLRAGDGREIIQCPHVNKSWRCKDSDFLPQLVRGHIANKTLLFFQSSEGRTPLLIDKVRNVDMEVNILEIPQLKALAHVVDDFDSGPWRPPEPPRKEISSPWAV